MLSHCLHSCGRVTDTGWHNYYILQWRLCYVRVAPVPRILFGLGSHKKNGSAVQFAKRGAANKWCTVCCCWPYKPVMWLSRMDESTRGSAMKIGGRLPARRREGKIDGRILIYGEKERKIEGEEAYEEEEEEEEEKVVPERDESSLLPR